MIRLKPVHVCRIRAAARKPRYRSSIWRGGTYVERRSSNTYRACEHAETYAMEGHKILSVHARLAACLRMGLEIPTAARICACRVGGYRKPADYRPVAPKARPRAGFPYQAITRRAAAILARVAHEPARVDEMARRLNGGTVDVSLLDSLGLHR